MIISGDVDGSLRSWRLDGSRGPLDVTDAHRTKISALVVVEHVGAPLIISASVDGHLRSWQLVVRLLALRSPQAGELEVRELSLGSLEVVVHLMLDVLQPVAIVAGGAVTVTKLSKILDMLKRLLGYRAEVRLHTTIVEAEQLEAKARVLEARHHLAGVQAEHERQLQAQRYERQLQGGGWAMDRAVLTDGGDDDVL